MKLSTNHESTSQPIMKIGGIGYLEHYDTLGFHLADVETAMLNAAAPKSQYVDQLITIPGISATVGLAIIALARKILVIIYTMPKQGTDYDESNFENRRKKHKQNRTSHYKHELEKLGYRVEQPAYNDISTLIVFFFRQCLHCLFGVLS